MSRCLQLGAPRHRWAVPSKWRARRESRSRRPRSPPPEHLGRPELALPHLWLEAHLRRTRRRPSATTAEARVSELLSSRSRTASRRARVCQPTPLVWDWAGEPTAGRSSPTRRSQAGVRRGASARARQWHNGTPSRCGGAALISHPSRARSRRQWAFATFKPVRSPLQVAQSRTGRAVTSREPVPQAAHEGSPCAPTVSPRQIDDPGGEMHACSGDAA